MKSNFLFTDEDGSFGSSVTFSSLAIAALSNRPSKFLINLNCENIWTKDAQDTFEMRISIKDTFYAKQTFYDRIPGIKRNSSLDDVLETYALANPKSLVLVTEKVLSRVLVQSINGLENHDDLGYKWAVYKVPNDNILVGFEEAVKLKSIKVPVEEGYTYEFIYQ